MAQSQRALSDAELRRIMKRAADGGLHMTEFYADGEGGTRVSTSRLTAASDDPRKLGDFLIHAHDDIVRLAQEIGRLQDQVERLGGDPYRDD
jgi:hypothetical protein